MALSRVFDFSTLHPEFESIDFGELDGVLDMVFFDCPNPGCAHLVGVPYARSSRHLSTGLMVWQRVRGAQADDLTLEPAVRVAGCGVVGWIRDGSWCVETESFDLLG
jgi:hypothetical protein